jgi:hypothetical protein
MKKHILLLMFSAVSIICFSQQKYQATVYLKNGNIVPGVIIERFPDESIKFKIDDTHILHIQKDEILKITIGEIGKRSKEPSAGENITKNLISNSSSKRKGYMGLSFGPSIPLRDYDIYSHTKTGIQLTLVDYGYLFNNNFGVTAVIIGTANPSEDHNYNNWNYSYVNLMAGPLVSISITERFSLELRPLIGISFVSVFGYPVIAYGLDNGFRFNAGEKIAFILRAGYSVSKGITQGLWEGRVNCHYETITVGFGVAYRLRYP